MARRPLTLILAAGLEALLCLAVAAEGVFVLASTLLGRASDVEFALPLAVFALGAAAALGYVAWGLYALHSWARTPVVLTQIFAIVVAASLWSSGQQVWGAALGAVAVAALGLVLAPPTTAVLFPADDAARRGSR
ncbi:hypothetical protein [Marinitenerispora sediminis]|uniref:Integral membrane protein n=1 Tax=Marinitenerispora sediminis TaxID=1931232 RepID=A0A368T889_9ACTN|nr:hypothetical protein [Marinitenerispora sediminis]RCV50611.1 hypothetical protein DEF28_17615 [Marinitenerispora sediminis]RCV58326.1 hypothetical protein DEF23_09050 [Marinitenerispora sediminis]RCV60455.1 hypothetical protein DEF24_07175 [Marinitenerispora sediminis]